MKRSCFGKSLSGLYFAMMPSHLDKVQLFFPKSSQNCYVHYEAKFGLRFEYLQTNLAKYPHLFINDFYKSIVDYTLEDMIMNFAIIVSLTIRAVLNVCLFSSFVLNLLPRQSLLGFGVMFCLSYSVIEA